MHSSATKGAIAEAKAISDLTKMGYICSLPVVHAAQYDVLVDIRGHIVKVQVKHGFWSENTFRVNLRHRAGGQDRKYEPENVDAFIFYDDSTDCCFWYWYDEVPDTKFTRVKMNGMSDYIMQRRLPNFTLSNI